ncbi:MAG: hypothetical protein JWO89_1813 [Verrucomicrobiaceae bacterium]|nr:hypothetical protein [Verrucomicrobiaceae bacterium]
MSPPPASPDVPPPCETKGGVWRFALLALITLFACIAILVVIVMGLPSRVPDAEIAATVTDIRTLKLTLRAFTEWTVVCPAKQRDC